MKTGLLASLAALFHRGDRKPASAEELVDPRVATIALLLHAARVDGRAGPRERQRLSRLVAAHLVRDADEVAGLIAAAARVDAETADAVDLARRLTLTLDAAGRRDLLAHMWDLATVDGGVHEFEDGLITRIGEVFELSADEITGLRVSAGLERATEA